MGFLAFRSPHTYQLKANNYSGDYPQTKTAAERPIQAKHHDVLFPRENVTGLTLIITVKLRSIFPFSFLIFNNTRRETRELEVEYVVDRSSDLRK
jgi:hypothetical protein